MTLLVFCGDKGPAAECWSLNLARHFSINVWGDEETFSM